MPIGEKIVATTIVIAIFTLIGFSILFEWIHTNEKFNNPGRTPAEIEVAVWEKIFNLF